MREKISQKIENGDCYSYEIELTRFPHDSVVAMNHHTNGGNDFSLFSSTNLHFTFNLINIRPSIMSFDLIRI